VLGEESRRGVEYQAELDDTFGEADVTARPARIVIAACRACPLTVTWKTTSSRSPRTRRTSSWSNSASGGRARATARALGQRACCCPSCRTSAGRAGTQVDDPGGSGADADRALTGVRVQRERERGFGAGRCAVAAGEADEPGGQPGAALQQPPRRSAPGACWWPDISSRGKTANPASAWIPGTDWPPAPATTSPSIRAWPYHHLPGAHLRSGHRHDDPRWRPRAGR
jgi:hypothetical protein